MIKEFKEFAVSGNVMDLAVGIVIGAAFKGIIDSFVADILTPLLGLMQKTWGKQLDAAPAP